MTDGPGSIRQTADSDMSDLPRTLRREHEARARAAAGLSAEAASYSTTPDQGYAATSVTEPYPAAVKRFEVPFFHLVRFFLKAVFRSDSSSNATELEKR